MEQDYLCLEAFFEWFPDSTHKNFFFVLERIIFVNVYKTRPYRPTVSLSKMIV